MEKKSNKLVLVFIFLITGALAGAAIWIGLRLSREEEVTPEEPAAWYEDCSAGTDCGWGQPCEWPNTAFCTCRGTGYTGAPDCQCWHCSEQRCGTRPGCCVNVTVADCSNPPTCNPPECPAGWDDCGTSVTCNGPCTEPGCQLYQCIECATPNDSCSNKTDVCRYCKQGTTTTTTPTTTTTTPTTTTTTRTTTTTTPATTTTTPTTTTSTPGTTVTTTTPTTTTTTTPITTTTTPITTTTTPITTTATTTPTTITPTTTTTTTLPRVGVFDDAVSKTRLAIVLIIFGVATFALNLGTKIFEPIVDSIVQWTEKSPIQTFREKRKEKFEKKLLEKQAKGKRK